MDKKPVGGNMNFDKSFLKSKTLWLALATILSGFLPELKEHFTPENAELILGSIGAGFGILRLFTKKPVVLKENKE